MTKTLLDPDSGPAVVSDTVRFGIVLVNSGPTDVVTPPLVDVFDDQYLTYLTASPLPNNVVLDQQMLVWYNLGPLPSGGTRTLTVDFHADAACDDARNAAGVDGAVDEYGTPAPAVLDDATVDIVAPAAIDAWKSVSLLVNVDLDGLFSPGHTLRYDVTIQNTGGVAATGVAFSDALDPHTSLAVGSVQTSQGTVTTGNGACDSSVSAKHLGQWRERDHPL